MMNRIFGLLALCFAFTLSAHAQRFESGLQLGVNMSQVGGDNMAGFNKAGAFGGFWVSYPLQEKLSWGIALNYSGEGSRRVINENNTGSGNWDLLHLNYLEVPLTITYQFRERIDFFGGAAGSYLISSKGYWVNGSSINDDFLKPWEVSILGGAKYQLFDRLNGFARGSLSLLSFNKGQSNFFFERNYGLINVVVTAGLEYNLTTD